MARRRMIDPNIWSSEDMSKLTVRQRLLVIGLFSNADDHGKGKAKATYVRSIVFPYDDISTEEVENDLQAISAVISVQFYEVEGNSYYKFDKWEKWQTVQKPQPSIIPEPVENHSGIIPEPFSPKGKEEKGKEKGKEGEGIPLEPLPPKTNPHKDRLGILIKECEITKIDFYTQDLIYSYVGVVDIEVIEAAIKKSSGKSLKYALNTLEGMVKQDGITRADQLPKGGLDNEKPRGVVKELRPGGTTETSGSTQGKAGVLPSKYFTADDLLRMSEVSG